MNDLQQLASACKNLAEYIDKTGNAADPRIIRAQVELIEARHEVASGTRSATGSPIGG